MNAGRDFLDTNVLVYADDRSDPARQAIASRVLSDAVDSRTGVVCVQVLKEFYQVVTRKLAAPLRPAEARARVRDLATTLRVANDSLEVLRDALRLCEAERISVWDAFIVASAAAAGCGRLLTEDLDDGRVLLGVRITNPFLGAAGVEEAPQEFGDDPDDWPTLRMRA